jgi:hypothetical protein
MISHLLAVKVLVVIREVVQVAIQVVVNPLTYLNHLILVIMLKTAQASWIL